MSKFETVVLFSPELSSANLKKEENLFEKLLKTINGDIISQEDWGLRNLSYSIKNNKKAFYKFYQIEAEGNKIHDIKKNINQNEKILRYLFIKVPNHAELPTKIFKSENK